MRPLQDGDEAQTPPDDSIIEKAPSQNGVSDDEQAHEEAIPTQASRPRSPAPEPANLPAASEPPLLSASSDGDGPSNSSRPSSQIHGHSEQGSTADEILSDFIHDAKKVIDFYGEGLESFLPHVIRFIRMQKNGYKTFFVAKDSHYYWALDKDALPTEAPIKGVLRTLEGKGRKTPAYHLPNAEGRCPTCVSQARSSCPVMKRLFPRASFRSITRSDLVKYSNCMTYYAKGAQIYAQGAVFPTMPGKYCFPQSEGYVLITSDQKVIMKTRKNGASYVSPNPQPAPEAWSG